MNSARSKTAPLKTIDQRRRSQSGSKNFYTKLKFVSWNAGTSTTAFSVSLFHSVNSQQSKMEAFDACKDFLLMKEERAPTCAGINDSSYCDGDESSDVFTTSSMDMGLSDEASLFDESEEKANIYNAKGANDSAVSISAVAQSSSPDSTSDSDGCTLNYQQQQFNAETFELSELPTELNSKITDQLSWELKTNERSPSVIDFEILIETFGSDFFEKLDFEKCKCSLYHQEQLVNVKTLELFDLPTELISKITDQLSWETQLLLRRVSRELKEVIDRKKPKCKSVSILYHGNHIFLRFDDMRLMYSTKNCKEKYSNGRRIEDEQYINLAMGDLAFVLNNPKVELEKFCLEIYTFPGDPMTELQNVFLRLNHTLPVGTVSFVNLTQERTMYVLSSFKPHTLRHLSLEYGNEMTNEIANLDQWKGLEMCYFDNPYPSTNIEYFLHMKKCTILTESISLNDLLRAKESCSKSLIFVVARFTSYREHYDLDALVERLDLTPYFFDENDENVDDYLPFIWHIPNTDDVLQFLILPHSVVIYKRKYDGKGIIHDYQDF